MERRQISNDIVIDGVPKSKIENCTQLVQQICNQINLKTNE